jgi:osmotically-inducible protein OsmY
MSAATLSPPTSTCPEAALSASPLPELRRLVVETTETEVVISGRVSSYYLKQLAQEAVRIAVGHRRLLNRVTVAR